jgi:transposase
VLDAICVEKPAGKGNARQRPARLLADKGYSHLSTRRLLRRRGILPSIPERSDQRERRAHKPGRKPAFDPEAYRRRNVVERCFGRLKQFRALATRYDKRALNYRACIVLARLLLWLPHDLPDTP